MTLFFLESSLSGFGWADPAHTTIGCSVKYIIIQTPYYRSAQITWDIGEKMHKYLDQMVLQDWLKWTSRPLSAVHIFGTPFSERVSHFSLLR